VALMTLLAARASAQASGCAIDVTATVVDMTESGGVGLRISTLAGQALERIGRRGASWPADTTVRLERAWVRVETAPSPRDTVRWRARVTVVHPG